MINKLIGLVYHICTEPISQLTYASQHLIAEVIPVLHHILFCSSVPHYSSRHRLTCFFQIHVDTVTFRKKGPNEHIYIVIVFPSSLSVSFPLSLTFSFFIDLNVNTTLSRLCNCTGLYVSHVFYCD